MLLIGGLMLPAFEDVRIASIALVKGLASEVKRMVVSGDYAEIRSVDGEDFEEVINEPRRVVIVVFHKKLRMSKQGEAHELEEEIKQLPARVLVAKITAEENTDLLRKLNISELPTVRVYQSGRLVRNFEREVGKDELISTVKSCLGRPDAGQSGPGYIGPMEQDWLPEGVYRTSPGLRAPTGKFE